jgi:predicted metallopeptidase
MPIKYYEAPDVKRRVDRIIYQLDLTHISPQLVYCCRSRGSKSRYVVARIHGRRRIWQEVLNLPPAYVIEVISERYDRLAEADQERTLIHELLHIPRGFAGGFRPHKGYVTREIVERLYTKLQRNKPGNV